PEPSAPASEAPARVVPKAARPIASATPVETPPPNPAPAPADTLALYRHAHRLHLSGQDPAAALAAWDAYLREDPSGAFALEARYNRAICLVRLHRANEAR